MNEGAWLGNLTLGYTFLVTCSFVSAKAAAFSSATSFNHPSLVAQTSPALTAIYAFKSLQKARDGTDKNHGPSVNMTYQIIELAHYHIPEGSSIVTATVRCSESNLSSNPIALYHKLLGGEGKVIRMTQLSPDSWMLVGHQYNDGASGAYNREGSMLHNTDRTGSLLSEAANGHVYHIDDDGDAE
ncbi:hypothetical protein K458DRAFT_389635 [Lentithecium fluviatile CBS 122367]|uniref:Uncharacterized protein n=1 Tax=Lentithecium fluviatile CBS 122367 TaxID=1168545 RepID=A0A6G1J0P1_9PLEO|nr:hypothetical protein K458DRAFT_389635 [Lentithecium fluviatile CBS 122367]